LPNVLQGRWLLVPQAWTVMSGRIVQGILKGRLFQQVSREIKDLREKGKIPDDFGDEKNNTRYFQSLG
jgi:hypothetical protein